MKPAAARALIRKDLLWDPRDASNHLLMMRTRRLLMYFPGNPTIYFHCRVWTLGLNLFFLAAMICFNAYFCSQSEARRAEVQKQLAFSFELIIGWLLRLSIRSTGCFLWFFCHFGFCKAREAPRGTSVPNFDFFARRGRPIWSLLILTTKHKRHATIQFGLHEK